VQGHAGSVRKRWGTTGSTGPRAGVAAYRFLLLVLGAWIGVAGCTQATPTPPPGTVISPAPLPPVASLPPTPTQSVGRDSDNEQAPAPVGEPGPAVAGFAAAWVRADLPADKWWAGVAPYCEAGFAQQLRTVDPGNLPASRVTGSPVQVSPPVGGVAVFTVATDGGVLMVTVAAVNGHWLVTNDDFQRAVR
jgi:hypothetical protein